jgi:predicted amidophosphoribosyltransferase
VSDLSDDYVKVQDGRRVCRKCYHHSRHLEDGYCPRCNGETQESIDAERQREAARRGARQTAAYLRRMGHPGEAIYHERRAR